MGRLSKSCKMPKVNGQHIYKCPLHLTKPQHFRTCTDFLHMTEEPSVHFASYHEDDDDILLDLQHALCSNRKATQTHCDSEESGLSKIGLSWPCHWTQQGMHLKWWMLPHLNSPQRDSIIILATYIPKCQREDFIAKRPMALNVVRCSQL